MKTRALSERALIVLLAAITASGPVSLSIYMPVVPLAREAFGVSVAAASTTVSAPLIAFAVGLFVYGPLSDHFGRRPVILVGLGIYLSGVAIALASTTIGMLTAGRVIAALGTSAGVTVARAAMGDLYARERMAQKFPVLHPHRLVESECSGEACNFGLVGLRIDQNIDRIADRKYADEYQCGHEQQSDYALQHPAYDENEHGSRVRKPMKRAMRCHDFGSESEARHAA